MVTNRLKGTGYMLGQLGIKLQAQQRIQLCIATPGLTGTNPTFIADKVVTTGSEA
jgi:hypothetical protein